jgi:hypothetical protein
VAYVIFSRRTLLAAAGSAAVLAACGENDADNGTVGTGNDTDNGTDPTFSDTTGGAPSDPIDPPEGGWALVQRFPNHPLFTPGEARLPISLANESRMLDNGPETLRGWIEDFQGNRAAEFTAPRHVDGLPTPYWEVRATLDKAVIYTLRVEGDDGFGATFELFDAADVATPVTGSKMPGFDTPTTDDHRGVEPYCSLTPDPCPLHAVTLTEALASGKPVAYMVGTPAHCSTGTCTPGLEFLVAEGERVGDAMVMVHADVYADDAATVVAPAVEALGAQYEPIIYFMDAEGTVVDRLDAIWDRSELRQRIDALLA